MRKGNKAGFFICKALLKYAFQENAEQPPSRGYQAKPRPLGGDSRGRLLTTVSPFKPTKQNTIFYANSCWAIGIVVDENSDKGLAKIDVKRLSCIDNSGKAYEYGFTDNSNKRIGYVSSKETIGHDWIIALKDKNKLIIPSEKDVLINIETPINNLKLMGNINNTKALLDRLQDK